MTGNELPGKLPDDLNIAWAWSRVEACADGSLRGDQQARMRAAMARDPALAEAVDRARELRATLRDLRADPVPAGLRRRLLAIGHRSDGRGRPVAWRAFAPPVLGLATVVLIALLVFRPAPEPALPTPPMTAHEDASQAIEEFSIAMSYLRIGAERSSEQLSDAVGTSLRLALATSHETLLERHAPGRNEPGESSQSNGG